jgi:hypothetical protein
VESDLPVGSDFRLVGPYRLGWIGWMDRPRSRMRRDPRCTLTCARRRFSVYAAATSAQGPLPAAECAPRQPERARDEFEAQRDRGRQKIQSRVKFRIGRPNTVGPDGRVGSDGQAAEPESDGWMAKKGIRLHPWWLPRRSADSQGWQRDLTPCDLARFQRGASHRKVMSAYMRCASIPGR